MTHLVNEMTEKVNNNLVPWLCFFSITSKLSPFCSQKSLSSITKPQWCWLLRGIHLSICEVLCLTDGSFSHPSPHNQQFA